jgi:hypothetical protein
MIPTNNTTATTTIGNGISVHPSLSSSSEFFNQRPAIINVKATSFQENTAQQWLGAFRFATIGLPEFRRSDA